MSTNRDARHLLARAPVKLAVFALAVTATIGGGALIGAAIGPDADDEAGDTTMPGMSGIGDEDDGESLPPGLSVSRDGYTLVLAAAELPADIESELEFVITGPDGEPVDDFDVAHEKELHLVIVSRDLVGYAHIHPERDEDGTWRVDVPALTVGSYRVFADFVPADADGVVLGADLAVPGEFDPSEPPDPAATASVDGYTVTFDGELVAGTESELTLSVEHGGEPVDDLDPYLGALGHLVAIRGGDLAYLHVHPIDETDGPGGPDVRFAVEVPTAGSYRLFFDFSHGGEVRTAAVTFVAGDDGHSIDVTASETTEGGGGHDGH